MLQKSESLPLDLKLGVSPLWGGALPAYVQRYAPWNFPASWAAPVINSNEEQTT